MGKQKTGWRWVSMMLLFMLVGCGASVEPQPAATKPAATSVAPQVAATRPAATPTAAAIATLAAEKSKDHDEPSDYVWNASQVVQIALQGNTIAASGAGVKVNGAIATIVAPGTYSISGALNDGQIIVNTTGKGVVRLVLNGADIHSSTGSPIYVMSADKTVLVLADNTRNSVSDAKSYVLAANETEPNAAIFSKGDLTIFGNGSLSVAGNFNDGIASKDGLIITSGTITVNAVDDGIRGKDYLIVKGGNVTVTAQGDGLKADNAQDPTRGYISIADGVLKVTSGRDAIQAQSDVMIAKGKFVLTAGGGSNGRIDANTSAKGIKGVTTVTIGGGTFTIDSADDAVHSNGGIVVNGGAFAIATGDDGMHADATLQVNGGDIKITKSYEGLESAVITINDGTIRIVSSDDGLNGAGGNDGSGIAPGPGFGGARGARPPGQDTFAAAAKYWLYIRGGYIVIEAVGDGIDINGSIEMTNGVVIVNGPIVRMNSALDYDATFKLTGGFLVAAGSSGMAQAPDDSSTQYALLLNTTTTQRAGDLVHIRSSDGKSLLTFAPTKEYQSIAFSSPELVKGTTYEVYFGGSSTGTVKDGVYQNGTYSPGTKNTSFTTSSVVTRIGVTRFR